MRHTPEDAIQATEDLRGIMGMDGDGLHGHFDHRRNERGRDAMSRDVCHKDAQVPRTILIMSPRSVFQSCIHGTCAVHLEAPLRGHGLSCLRMKLAIARDMGCGNDRVTPRHDVNFLNDPSAQNCNRREQAMALIHLVCIYDIDRLRWTFLVSAVAITPSLAAARPHTARCSRLPPHSTIPPAENAGSPRSRPSVPSMLVAGQRLRRQ